MAFARVHPVRRAGVVLAGGVLLAVVVSVAALGVAPAGAATPTRLTGVTKVTGDSADHSSALRTGGTVWCWGNDTEGQFGTGTRGDVDVSAVPAVGISGAIDVATEWETTSAVLTGGTVKCWGGNQAGELGAGLGDDDVLIPVAVVGITNAVAVSAGGAEFCALLATGHIACWGADGAGQLGDGTTGDASGIRSTPVAVAGISTATQVSAGDGHTCALLTAGTIKCWGAADKGQLGDGTTGGSAGHRLTPVTVVGITAARAVAAGGDHTCALTQTGKVKCWGQNEVGELGDGTTTNRSLPITVPGIAGASQVSTTVDHTCALAHGTISCWGMDAYGQLGDHPAHAASPNFKTSPVAVAGLSGVSSISTSSSASFAVLAGGQVKGWGFDISGQLGDGTSGVAFYRTRLTPAWVVTA